jgi:hypothetical protein
LDAENLNLLTDDEGYIWAVSMGPRQGGPDQTWIDAFRLKSDGKGGITISFGQTGADFCNQNSSGLYVCAQGDYLWRMVNSGVGASDAGAGMYVTPDGALRMYGTGHYGSNGTVWITER